MQKNGGIVLWTSRSADHTFFSTWSVKERAKERQNQRPNSFLGVYHDISKIWDKDSARSGNGSVGESSFRIGGEERMKNPEQTYSQTQTEHLTVLSNVSANRLDGRKEIDILISTGGWLGIYHDCNHPHVRKGHLYGEDIHVHYRLIIIPD